MTKKLQTNFSHLGCLNNQFSVHLNEYYRSQSESLLTFCASLTVCLSLSEETNKTSEYGRSTTSSVISENLSLVYRMVSVQFFSKNVWLINFFATQQFRRFWWLILPLILLAYTACKELKIAQITHDKLIMQLFHLLNLVRLYGHGFY